MGRRKIAIQPIPHERNRAVTFIKRKNGLFKKAYELGVLCSVDVAVIIFEERHGEHPRLYQYCSADIDDMVRRQTRHAGEQDLKTPSDFMNADNPVSPDHEEFDMDTLQDNPPESPASYYNASTKRRGDGIVKSEGDTGTGGGMSLLNHIEYARRMQSMQGPPSDTYGGASTNHTATTIPAEYGSSTAAPSYRVVGHSPGDADRDYRSAYHTNHNYSNKKLRLAPIARQASSDGGYHDGDNNSFGSFESSRGHPTMQHRQQDSQIRSSDSTDDVSSTSKVPGTFSFSPISISSPPPSESPSPFVYAPPQPSPRHASSSQSQSRGYGTHSRVGSHLYTSHTQDHQTESYSIRGGGAVPDIYQGFVSAGRHRVSGTEHSRSHEKQGASTETNQFNWPSHSGSSGSDISHSASVADRTTHSSNPNSPWSSFIDDSQPSSLSNPHTRISTPTSAQFRTPHVKREEADDGSRS